MKQLFFVAIFIFSAYVIPMEENIDTVSMISVIENQLPSSAITSLSNKESAFTLLEKTSHLIAAQAVKHAYNVSIGESKYDAFMEYVHLLPHELQANLIEITVSKFGCTNIFTDKLIACFDAYQTSHADERVDKKEKLVNFFKNFSLRVQSSLFNSFLYEMALSEQHEHKLLELMLLLIDAQRYDRDVLANFFVKLSDFNSVMVLKANKVMFDHISAILDSVHVIFQRNVPDLPKHKVLAEDLLNKFKQESYQSFLQQFRMLDQKQKNMLTFYLSCYHLPDNGETDDIACQLCFFIINPLAFSYSASNKLAEFPDDLKRQAFFRLNAVCKDIARIHPAISELYEHSGSDFLRYCKLKNHRVGLLNALYRVRDDFAFELIKDAALAGNVAAMSEIVSKLNKRSISLLYGERLFSHMFTDDETQQKIYIDSLLAAFLPVLIKHMQFDEKACVREIFDGVSNFYYVSCLREPLSEIFERHLSILENQREAGILCERLTQLYNDDLRRIKHKKFTAEKL